VKAIGAAVLFSEMLFSVVVTGDAIGLFFVIPFRFWLLTQEAAQYVLLLRLTSYEFKFPKGRFFYLLLRILVGWARFFAHLMSGG
jgi:hypothetical protein